MVLEKLGQSLRQTIGKITGSSFVDEKLINELVKDVQRSLLQADVNVSDVFEIAKNLKKRMLSEKPPTGLSRKDFLVHILYEELADTLGGDYKPLTITRPSKSQPYTFMLVGLFGNGKTTTAGKLAKYYIKRSYKVALFSTDTWRPAAFEQLKQNGEKIGVPVYGNPNEKDPVKLYQSFTKELEQYDIVIVDTAGRDRLNEELVFEIESLYDVVKPQETLLVLNADIGQSAKEQATTFQNAANVSGVIITKLDGTAKGGGALSACRLTKAPVLFIGTGEKVDDFEEFKPKNFVGQLLGMGDMEKLLQKAQEAFSQEEVSDLSKRLVKGEFTLIDLYEQMEAMKKMGPLSKVMNLIPGMGGAQIPKEVLEGQQEKMIYWKYIMNSCTKEELGDPTIISTHRITRIARGSGTSEVQVRELLKHYKQSKKMLKVMKGIIPADGDVEKEMSEKDMQKMMRKMGGMKSMMKHMKFK